MSVTLDATSSGYQNYGGTLTIPHTCSGTQRELVAVCGIGGTANDKVSGATYAGVPMTRRRSEAGSGPTAVTYVYELVNPPAGTANVVWTFTTTDVTAQGYNASFNGVDQTTPVAGTTGHNSSFAASPLGDTLTLPTGGMVMDIVAAGIPSSDGPLTPSGTQTQIGTPNTQGLIITAASTSSTSGAMSWTWTGGAQRAGSHSMIALNPVIVAVNLTPAPSTETPTSSTGAATVTPATAGTVNLIAASSTETPTSSTGAATVSAVTATVTSDVFKGFGGLPLANLNIPNVMLIKLDRTVALSLANQVTNGSGQLVIASAALVSGTDYMLATFNADGTLRGMKKYTAV